RGPVAAVRVVRLQAWPAAGRGLHLRRALPSQPALGPRAASPDRARRAGARLPGLPGAGGGIPAGRHRFPGNLAAALRQRRPQLRDGLHRLHRRSPPLGLPGGKAGRTLPSGQPRGAHFPPRAGLTMGTGVLLITHATVGQALIDAARHVMPQLPLKTLAMEVPADADIDAMRRLTARHVRELDDGDGVLVMSDLYGATPCNLGPDRKSVV